MVPLPFGRNARLLLARNKHNIHLRLIGAPPPANCDWFYHAVYVYVCRRYPSCIGCGSVPWTLLSTIQSKTNQRLGEDGGRLGHYLFAGFPSSYYFRRCRWDQILEYIWFTKWFVLNWERNHCQVSKSLHSEVKTGNFDLFAKISIIFALTIFTLSWDIRFFLIYQSILS